MLLTRGENQPESAVNQVINEIAQICHSEIPLNEFLPRFLQTTLSAIGAAGGGIWFPHEDKFQCVAHMGGSLLGYHEGGLPMQSIDNALQDVARNQRAMVVGPRKTEALVTELKKDEIVNFTAHPVFYVPVVSAEGHGKVVFHAVLQAWLQEGDDSNRYKLVVTFLQEAARQAGIYLRYKRMENAAAGTARLQQFVQLLGELSGELDLDRLGISIANWCRQITGCDRCTVFVAKPGGEPRAIAISNVEQLNQKSALVQSQKRLAMETLQAGVATLYTKAKPVSEALGDISDYFFHSHSNEALALPISRPDSRPVGVLLVESHKEKRLDAEAQNLARGVASRSAPALASAMEIASMPLYRPMRKIAQFLHHWRTGNRKRTILRVGVPVLLAAAVILFPVHFTIQSDCVVTPVLRAQAVSEVGGRVVKVLIREGDKVVTGQVLAQLDDMDMQNNLHIAQQEKIKFETEANRGQAKGDEGLRRIMQLEAERTEQQIRQINMEIEKSRIKSPIDGVVLTKQPELRIGEVLPLGGRFCEVGDVTRWEAEIHVPESEVGLLDQKLRKKALPASFLLHAMPERNFKASINNVNAISQVSSPIPGGNVFVVRAEVQPEPDLSALLKPGYTGRSKIPIGLRPAIYVATRKFVNYLRVRWLF